MVSSQSNLQQQTAKRRIFRWNSLLSPAQIRLVSKSLVLTAVLVLMISIAVFITIQYIFNHPELVSQKFGNNSLFILIGLIISVLLLGACFWFFIKWKNASLAYASVFFNVIIVLLLTAIFAIWNGFLFACLWNLIVDLVNPDILYHINVKQVTSPLCYVYPVTFLVAACSLMISAFFGFLFSNKLKISLASFILVYFVAMLILELIASLSFQVD